MALPRRLVLLALLACLFPASAAASLRDSPRHPKPACMDGLDNDSDGAIDYPDDGDCTGKRDPNESALPPPPADRDGDGVPDATDQCPDDPGPATNNGCPVSGGGGEPGPIAGQGYHQVLHDDFDTLDRSVWDSRIWYDDLPDPAWLGFQEAQGGILHLRTSRLFTGSFGNWPINTITTQSSGKTFQYGYFEVRMKWPGGHGSWPAFWLYSYQHAIDQEQCTTQAGEIDVMEGQGSEPNVFYGTVHSNTNGCAPGDDQNGNNWQPQNVDLTQGFHTYAAKWTQSAVTWYLDGQETHSAATYPTDDQPMFLLLQEWVGGWTTNPDLTTPDPLDNAIDSVEVWQQ